MTADVVIIQRVVPHYRAALFAALFDKHGWRVVCADNFVGTVKPMAVAGQVKLPFWFWGNEFRCWVPLRKICRQLQPKIIILEAGTAMSSTWLALLWCLLPTQFRPKIVFWLHGKPVGASGGWRAFVARLIKKLQVRLADGILTYTQGDVSYLAALTGGDTPIVATNNTVDIAPMLALRDVAPVIKTSAPVWLCVGRLTPDKQMVGVVEMFKVFLEIHPAATLFIVGEGVERENLEKAAGALLGERIILTGAIYEEAELAKYYAAADVFVLAGAAGLGVNHALAYGVPVVAFAEDEGGAGPHHHPEGEYIVDGVTGWLVTPYTPAAMLAKLEEIFARDESPQAQLGAPLADYAGKHLRIENMVAAFESIKQRMR